MTKQEVTNIIDVAIEKVVKGDYDGADIANLSLMYPNKENAVKIANCLLNKGLYEQYASMLELNNELDIREEFERVKKIDNVEGYIAIANYVPYSDFVYCQDKVMKKGTGLDIVKFMLDAKNANKVKAISELIKRRDANSLGYAIKYLDANSYQFLEQSEFIGYIREIIEESGSRFAKKALKERSTEYKLIKKNYVQSDNNGLGLSC